MTEEIFSYESEAEAVAVAAHLRRIADVIEHGSTLSLSSVGEEVEIDTDRDTDLEIEVERDQDGTELEIEITFEEADTGLRIE